MSRPRAIVLVCDSLGVGELPDAAEYGDAGSDTLGHILRDAAPRLPNLERLGLLRTLAPPRGTTAVSGAWGRMAERSAGKDTTTGHWEMMGLVVDEPFRTYPEGFPGDVIREYERRIGREVFAIGPASGTEIIDRLGEEHMRSGKPIVYTSGDSVFQVAAHEEVIPVEELWRICTIARELLRGEHNVGRIIARPFVGPGKGRFTRTANRRDFSVTPTGETVLDRVRRAGGTVAGVGKIADIFDRVGIDEEIRSGSNADGMAKTTALAESSDASLIFTNLVDFDSKYGHRNDVHGYARALEDLDARIPSLLAALRPDDILFLTADHGCDPTDVSTDHTREYVPFIAAGPKIRAVDVGIRSTLADLGATVSQHLGASREGLPGTSALDTIFDARASKTSGE